MKPYHDNAIGCVVALLNRDILREFRTADSCVRQATCLSGEYHPAVRRQIAALAAAAMRNATALAAEVLALGGMPIVPRHREPRALASKAIRQSPGTEHKMLAHYQRRVRMAERLGLFRLREVFLTILISKEQHLSHLGLLQAQSPSGRLYLLEYAWRSR